MSKKPKSLADRLILLVARLGERATVQNITGRHLVGAEFKQAKQDAAALVVWEPIYQMRQRRPGWGAQRSRKASTTAKLTKAGIWRAAQLGVLRDDVVGVAGLEHADRHHGGFQGIDVARHDRLQLIDDL